MSCCGILDVDGSTISFEKKMHQALHGIYLPHSKEQHTLLPQHFPAHLYNTSSAQALLTGRHSDDLVQIPCSEGPPCNEYDPHHLMNAFPTLFPYGIGSFADTRRKRSISWEKHISWMLRQSHHRFATHEIFMFVVFNILQKRKICLGAKLITSQAKLPRVATLLQNLDYAALHEKLSYERQATSGIQTFSDSILQQLMEATSIANGLVRGSKEYVRDRRNEIRGLFSRFGGPKFFVTINPDDVRHPLILALRNQSSTADEVLHIPVTENFAKYHRMRCQIIAENPVLQAQFFDIIFRSVIDVVFGFAREPKLGIFGHVQAYYAIIEAQGKGTLHAHGLIWLTDGTPAQ
jgi:hypothetical protein